MTDAVNVRNIGLDQFYTIKEYSKECIDIVNGMYQGFDLIVEPSAGDGSFYLQINGNKVGIDLDPKIPEISKGDFFDFTPNKGKSVLTIGNPPFGRVSSLAIRFFNHSAKWSNVVAFVVPRTFRKISVQNKLDLRFHLVHDSDTPTNPCSFTPKMSVKCCFQIWEKREYSREVISLPIEHPDFTFLKLGPLDNNKQPTPPTGADFAIRAYGGKIGEIKSEDLQNLRPKSWHWIKSVVPKEVLISKLNSLDYSSSENTARQNSMGKRELINLLNITL